MDENSGNDDEVVDWIVFCAARSELGAGFARILSYFREDGEKAVSRIEAAMQSRDTAGLVLPAHTMKSEARQFGAEPLGALAEEIEFTARRAIEIRAFPMSSSPRSRSQAVSSRRYPVEAEANPLVRRRRRPPRSEGRPAEVEPPKLRANAPGRRTEVAGDHPSPKCRASLSRV